MKYLIAITLLLVACGEHFHPRVEHIPGKDGYNSLISFEEIDDPCEGAIIQTGLDTNENGVLEDSEVYDASMVCNGSDGVDGIDAAVIEILDPCGDGPGHDEVILVLADGMYLAWYYNLGLTVLNPGQSYRTTDQQRCRFRIVDGELEEL